MLSRIILALLGIFCCCVQASDQKTSPSVTDQKVSQSTSGKLRLALQDESVIRFYFVSRTGTYSLSPSELKLKSTLQIIRHCGANCEDLMSEVVFHLEQAIPATCQQGQQSAVIEVGDSMLLAYSYSGRQIEVKGKCYFNKKNIKTVIEKAGLVFR